jgi:hypothetical protein
MQGTLAAVPTEDSTLKNLVFRLANIADFQSKYFDHSINTGYFLLFIYEMMHERISLDYREITDTLDTVSLNQENIQARHNQTLGKTLELWKPAVRNPVENAHR